MTDFDLNMKRGSPTKERKSVKFDSQQNEQKKISPQKVSVHADQNKGREAAKGHFALD